MDDPRGTSDAAFGIFDPWEAQSDPTYEQDWQLENDRLYPEEEEAE